MAAIGIILGICISIFGVYSLVTPFQTALAIGWIAGVVFLLYGIEIFIAALSAPKKSVWKCLLGIISAIAGAVILVSSLQRFLTDIMAACLLGIAIICYGIYQIIAGIRKLKVTKGMAVFGIILGAVSVIIGLLSVGHPIITLISLGYLIGFILIFQGINMIFISAQAVGKKAE